jgi:hypothetical protein
MDTLDTFDAGWQCSWGIGKLGRNSQQITFCAPENYQSFWNTMYLLQCTWPVTARTFKASLHVTTLASRSELQRNDHRWRWEHFYSKNYTKIKLIINTILKSLKQTSS